MSQYFHNTFIFSCGKFWFDILLFIYRKAISKGVHQTAKTAPKSPAK